MNYTIDNIMFRQALYALPQQVFFCHCSLQRSSVPNQAHIHIEISGGKVCSVVIIIIIIKYLRRHSRNREMYAEKVIENANRNKHTDRYASVTEIYE